jgi:hypothetical protein
MKKIIIYTIISCIIIFSNTVIAQSNSNYWKISSSLIEKSLDNSYLGEMPLDYKMANLNIDILTKELMKAVLTENRDSNENALQISIPNPDGTFTDFNIFENSVISPKVKDFYTIKTYQGYSIDAPNIKIRCDLTDLGFHAFVYNGQKSYAIEPFSKLNNTSHIVFYKNKINNKPIKCGNQDGLHPENDRKPNLNLNLRAPNNLRTFELAFVASGEYSQQYGGMTYSSTNVLNSFASALNMVNPIYETDLGITFTLVSTAALVFENPGSDPFDPFGNQGDLIEQNQIECDDALGNANYDVGHLLVWANTGGLAAAGVVCYDGYKALGFSGSNSSFVTLIVDYGCHEIGHQFNADHNFASLECETSSDDFRFEPGEGSSIMSYAGVCGNPASYQSYSNQFFHSASINVMNTYIDTWGGCETTSTPGGGNVANPLVNAQSNITIPKETPFILVGSATDANDAPSQLTYLWEQYDGSGGEVTGPPNCASTDEPLFRYNDPISDSYKVFPEFNQVLNGNNNGVTWEKLPCAARNIKFNLIVRDNNSNFGRTGNDEMTVTVANTGPFAVMTPNGGETWNEGATKTITWTENGTSTHCSTVDILLSKNNGSTFSILATAVANDGSHDIVVPAGLSSTARILIQCSVGGSFYSASTFFDVSDAVFMIEMALPVELVDFKAERYLKEKAKIRWTTGSEVNSSHFEVEKSLDGIRFETIGTVKSAGTTLNKQEYSLIDEVPSTGLNYYRLKQVDLDGQLDYSAIEVLSFSNNSKIIIYPNPAKDILNIEIDKLETVKSMVIHDQIGRLVFGSNTIQSTIDISELSDGIYYITIISNQVSFVERVIIKR